MKYLQLDEVIMRAFQEDMPMGDITTDNIISIESKSKATLTAKQSGVVCGIEVAKRVFELLDANVEFEALRADGDLVGPGDLIMRVAGNSRALLKGERTALNFIQHLSGVATETNKYAKLLEGLKTKVVDTRKTTPGLRYLEKYAVACGGGSNHRFSLSDGVLIKDNHIKAAGGISNAVSRVREKIPHTVKIEVETESLEMVQEALDSGADIIMLDNMTIEKMTQAVGLISGRALVEASGDIDEKKLVEVAKTGVDIISIGRITRSAGSLDISMRFVD
ncbi:MAG: carboxylating nicotinate-nucleotide diphosphorylase [Bacillota bacterium]